ncbi:hypothetical protein EJB05_35878, partial [Eragrostis curvula]
LLRRPFVSCRLGLLLRLPWLGLGKGQLRHHGSFYDEDEDGLSVTSGAHSDLVVAFDLLSGTLTVVAWSPAKTYASHDGEASGCSPSCRDQGRVRAVGFSHRCPSRKKRKSALRHPGYWPHRASHYLQRPSLLEKVNCPPKSHEYAGDITHEEFEELCAYLSKQYYRKFVFKRYGGDCMSAKEVEKIHQVMLQV